MKIWTSTEIKSFKILFRGFWSLSATPSASLSQNPCVEGTWRAMWARQQDGHGCFQLKLAEVEKYMQQSTFYEYVLLLWLTLEWSASDTWDFLRPYKLACLSQMFHWHLHVRVEWWSLTCLVWRVLVLNAVQQSVEACAGPLLPKLGFSVMFPSRHSSGSHHNVPTSMAPWTAQR